MCRSEKVARENHLAVPGVSSDHHVFTYIIPFHLLSSPVRKMSLFLLYR